MSSPEPDPLVGTVVDGRYRVLERLSEGGMGVVYRAQQVFLKREVALKRLHRELTGHGEAVARFEREAQAAAQIDHPNVCQVLDCGVGEDGAFFIAMELLSGTPLDRRIAEAAPLPLAEIVDIGYQICDALDHAHALGIVHRDLKPENVMLVPRRAGAGIAAKIMDFGIAKVAQEAGGSKLTQAGMVFGTPAYMAPEQAAGTTVDARADVYAMGVILFEMATGHCPFEAPTLSAVLTKQLTEDAPPLEKAAPQLAYPHPFRELVARCLVKDPDGRFASAAELAAALWACASLSAVSVSLPPAPVTAFPPVPAPIAAESRDTHAATMLSTSNPSLPSVRGPLTTGGAAATVYPATSFPRRSRVPWIVAGVVASLGLIAVVAVMIGRRGDRKGDGSRTSTAAGPLPAGALPPPPIALGPSSAGGRESATVESVAPAAATEPASETPLADLFVPPGAPTPQELLAAAAEERRAFESGDAEVAAALGLAGGGKLRAAITALDKLADRLDGDAHYHYELAMLHQRGRELPKAVEHALRAVELDPRYAADPELLGLAEASLASRPSAETAEKFFERVLDPTVAAQLVHEMLQGSRNSAVLRRVQELLTSLGFFDGLPDHLRLPLLAFAASNCTARKEILGEIQSRPDARMRPYLRRFKGESGCGFLGMQDCWSCERSALRATLAAVDAAPAGGGSGADAAP